VIVINIESIKNLWTARRVWIISASAALAVVFGVVLMFILFLGGRDQFFPGQMQIYFFNPAEGRLSAEGRPWPVGDENFLVASAISELSMTPTNRRLTSIWPSAPRDLDSPFFRYPVIYDGTLIAVFCESYLEMQPLQEALFRSAFTLTMLGLPFIDNVIIRAGDAEWTESATTIANAPEISPVRLANTQFVLYFIDESGEGLIRAYYDATDVNFQQLAREALERLIEGPVTEGAISVIPSETRIRRVIPAVETASIYVNLSSEFFTRFNGSTAQANLMIASIVNTVIENSPPGARPRQVFFLIDSARREEFHGVVDFDSGFEYNESVMVGFIPEEDEGE